MCIILEEILKIVKPTELAVKELSKNEATLLTSEGVFLFLFKKLREQNTDLSNEFVDLLWICIFSAVLSKPYMERGYRSDDQCVGGRCFRRE
jgi:hypothetical protein